MAVVKFYKKGGCMFSVFAEIELFFIQRVLLPRTLIPNDSLGKLQQSAK